MAKIITLPTFHDDRGSLTMIEKVANFNIKRVYYIYNTDGQQRGGHRHHTTNQILVCVSGSCEVFCENEKRESETFVLDNPSKSLFVEAKDWHTMQKFSKDCVLLVLASEYYNQSDYIDERY